MRGHKFYNDLVKSAMVEISCDEVAFNIISGMSSFTRMANNRILFDSSFDDALIEVEAVFGNKSGKARTNILSREALVECGKRASLIAQNSLPNEFYPGMNKSTEIKKCKTYFERTASLSSHEKSKLLHDFFSKTRTCGMNLAGNIQIVDKERLYINSHGISHYHPYTRFSTEIIVLTNSASGYSCFLSPDYGEFNHEEIIDRAILKCKMGQKSVKTELGRRDVILEPGAVGQIMEWLNFIAFNTESFTDKTSFMYGNSDKKLMGENISIYDDAFDNAGITQPFDTEGTPKEKIFFVKNGVVRDMVFNREQAMRNNAKSTGHAILFPNEPTNHAGADNLFIKRGESNIGEMIKSIQNGLYITRFHYINGHLKPQNATMTGLTRNGTFLIEKGEITSSVKNLRFTDSIVEAFNRAEMISSDLTRTPSWWSEGGCLTAPAMLIRDFQFTGHQEE